MKQTLAFLILILTTVQSNSQVIFRGVSPQEVVKSFNFTYTADANYTNPWGVDISQDGYMLMGELELVRDDSATKDSLGCEQTGNDLTGKIAFIYRGDCYFDQKIFYAQNRGAIGVVVVNNEPDGIIGMAPGSFASQVTIPAIMISMVDGAFLKQYMDQGSVEVMLGNMQGYYGYNLAVEKEVTLVPNAGSKPTMSMNGVNSWDFELGSFLINRGSNNLSQALLEANVTKGSDTLYQEQTVVQNLDAGDTSWFSLPNFTSTDKTEGQFKLQYIAKILDQVDEDNTNDTITYYFNNAEDVFSLVALDDNNLPKVNYFTTSGSDGLTSFTQCIKFQDVHAEELAVTGLYFAVQDETNASIYQDEMNLLAYYWGNTYDGSANPIDSNFDFLDELNSTYFYFDEDSQDSIIYAEFNDPILLENDKQYLFCINPSSKVDLLIGYDESIDYSLNDNYFEESNNPLRVYTGGITPKWYEGFVGSLTPSIGVKFISAEAAGLESISINNPNLRLFPNPSKEYVIIENTENESIQSIQVIDVYGKLVQEINIDSPKHKMNTSNFISGMYFVRITESNGNTTNLSFVKD